MLRNPRALLPLSFLLLLGCRHRIPPPPPSLFPLASAWVATLEGDGGIEPEVIEPPLATDGQRIIVSTRGGLVYGLDIATGTVQWRIPGRPGRLASAEDTVILQQPDGIVWRMDSDTGSARWKVETGVAGERPPVVDGARIFIAGNGLVGLDLGSGEAVWERRDGAPITAGPTTERGFLVVGRADGSLEALRKNTGRTVWSKGKGPAIVASPIIDDRERVLLGTNDNYFQAFNLRSGDRLWRWRIGADVRSAGMLFENRVLFASYENVVYSLDRGNGHMIWRTPLPSRPLSGPHPVGGTVLVVCADSDLVAIGPATGKSLGAVSLKLGPSGAATVIRTPPLRVGGRLFVGLSSPLAVAALDLPAGVAP